MISCPVRDIPLLDRLYARVTVSVNEGWQPHAGPKQLLRDPPNPLSQVIESDEEVEPFIPIQKSASRGKGKVGSSSKQERLTTAIEDQGRFWKGGRETFESLNPFCCAVCMQELLKITSLDHGNELYWAAIDYLASDESGRQIFMSLPSDAEKIKFLERKTGAFTLILIQRLLGEGDQAYEQEIFFATRRGTRLLNMSDFRDVSRSNSWDYSAFVRTYALYLDERLDFRMQARHGKRGVYCVGGETEEDEKDKPAADLSTAIVVKSQPIAEMKTEHIFTRVQNICSNFLTVSWLVVPRVARGTTEL
ncbi:unnamed protein product [Thlaspi arvense]|uniref:ENTH domain-containing protein n=1 Tax=Thlaspi arvense TaxID=13288 RepID=A0AAU9RW44_THLAR|nr:unnamed protein product [Thlaspi arvense]